MAYTYEMNAERERLEKAIIDMLDGVDTPDLRELYFIVSEMYGLLDK